MNARCDCRKRRGKTETDQRERSRGKTSQGRSERPDVLEGPTGDPHTDASRLEQRIGQALRVAEVDQAKQQSGAEIEQNRSHDLSDRMRDLSACDNGDAQIADKDEKNEHRSPERTQERATRNASQHARPALPETRRLRRKNPDLPPLKNGRLDKNRIARLQAHFLAEFSGKRGLPLGGHLDPHRIAPGKNGPNTLLYSIQ